MTVEAPAAPASPPVAPVPPAPPAPVAAAVVVPPAPAPPADPAAPAAPVVSPVVAPVDPAAPAPIVFALKVPEGYEAFLDASDLDTFKGFAQTHGWTNDETQAEIQARAEDLKKQDDGFRARLAAHPTYGGEHLADTERLATVALDHIAPKGDPLGDEFRRLLTKHAFANNLPLVAALARAGREWSEDRPAGSGGASGEALEFQSPRDLYKGTTGKV